MSAINAIKKIVAEDFPAASRDVVLRLATVLNPFLVQAAGALNGGLTLRDNLKSKSYVIDLPAGTSTKAVAWALNEKPTAVYVGSLTKSDGKAPGLAATTFLDAAVTAATDRIAITAHPYVTGSKVTASTTGVLPAGLSARAYYIISVDSNTVKLALSPTDAAAGTAVDITAAAGGGTHTLTSDVPVFCLSWRYQNGQILLTLLGLETATHHTATIIAQV